MAVVIYLLLLRRGVPRWLAALAIAPVLLDAYQLQNEQTIMPGTWFEALIVAGIAILLWQPRTSWRRVVAAGIVLGTSATVAQVGEALIPAAAIFLLAAGGGWRRAIGKAAALCAACALPILAYCTGSYLLTGDFFLSHTGVTSFYGRTAAAVDCATIKLPPAERGLCPTKAQQARGPDWLEYGHGSPIRRYYRDLPRAEVDSLVTNFNHRVLAQQPLRVLDAYGRDVLKLFAVDRVTAARRPAHLPLAVPDHVPVLLAARHARRSSRPRSTGSAAARPPSGGPSPRSCAPTSSTAATPPARCWPLCTLAGLAGSAVVLRRRADPADPPARPGLPAVLHLGRVRCCWSRTCSSSPGGTSCPRWSRSCRQARSGSASSSARSGTRRPPPAEPADLPAEWSPRADGAWRAVARANGAC